MKSDVCTFSSDIQSVRPILICSNATSHPFWEGIKIKWLFQFIKNTMNSHWNCLWIATKFGWIKRVDHSFSIENLVHLTQDTLHRHDVSQETGMRAKRWIQLDRFESVLVLQLLNNMTAIICGSKGYRVALSPLPKSNVIGNPAYINWLHSGIA